MHAGPKTAFIVVFFVVFVWGQVPAAGQEEPYSPPVEPASVVSVTSQGSAGSSGIKSCPISERSTPSFKVHFQTLKTKTATFTRTLLDKAVILTYASQTRTVSVSNIANCVNVADAEGFEVFSFFGGTCEMFKMEYQACKCKTGGQELFYVQASFWGPKDSTLPQMAYVGVHRIAVVDLPSTFSDQQQLFEGRTFSTSMGNASSLAQQSLFSCLQSITVFDSCKCVGNECFKSFFLDIRHCVPKSCDASGNTTILQSISYGPTPWTERVPMLYILSECGKTIVLEPSSPTESQLNVRVMSHQGYGCQWYPKTGADHECVVTISSGNRTSTSDIGRKDMVLDGDTTTCEGDTLSVHNGAPTNSSLLKRYDACTTVGSDSNRGNNSNVTLVFKRTAKQYQKDGFNWGFTLLVKLKLGP